MRDEDVNRLIKQAEQPLVKTYCGGKPNYCTPVDAVNMSQDRVDETAKCEHEPVAWMYVNTDGECEQIEYGEPFDDPSVAPLYAAPPKKEWVGLTANEVLELLPSSKWKAEETLLFVQRIEDELKHKNSP